MMGLNSWELVLVGVWLAGIGVGAFNALRSPRRASRLVGLLLAVCLPLFGTAIVVAQWLVDRSQSAARRPTHLRSA